MFPSLSSIQNLLKKDPAKESKTQELKDALLVAARNGDEKAVAKLLENNEITNEMAAEAVVAAAKGATAQSAHKKIIEMIFKERKGISLLERPKLREAMEEAERRNDAEILKTILDQSQSNILMSGDSSKFLLQCAVTAGHTETAKVILDKFPDILMRQPFESSSFSLGNEYLNTAIESGHMGIVALLVSHRRHEGSHHYGFKPYYYLERAIQNGNAELVKVILNNSNNSQLRQYQIKDAYDLALKKNHSETILAFLGSNHIEVETVLYDALERAIKNGNVELVKVLLNNSQLGQHQIKKAYGLALKKNDTETILAFLASNRIRVETVLCDTIGQQDCKILTYGLANYSDSSVVDFSPLLLSAAKNRFTTSLEMILDAKPDISISDIGAALCVAAKAGLLFNVGTILRRRRDISTCDEGGVYLVQALNEAKGARLQKMTQFLYDYIVYLNSNKNHDFKTPFAQALKTVIPLGKSDTSGHQDFRSFTKEPLDLEHFYTQRPISVFFLKPYIGLSYLFEVLKKESNMPTVLLWLILGYFNDTDFSCLLTEMEWEMLSKNNLGKINIIGDDEEITTLALFEKLDKSKRVSLESSDQLLELPKKDEEKNQKIEVKKEFQGIEALQVEMATLKIKVEKQGEQIEQQQKQMKKQQEQINTLIDMLSKFQLQQPTGSATSPSTSTSTPHQITSVLTDLSSIFFSEPPKTPLPDLKGEEHNRILTMTKATTSQQNPETENNSQTTPPPLPLSLG